MTGAYDSRGGKISPSRVDGLFRDEGHQVKLGIKLVSLCAGIGEEALLVELFSNLSITKS
jgi:hypothetical protein